MRLLLDTHILLAMLEAGSTRLPPEFADVLKRDASELVVSSASLWEIAIKVRAGKLEIGMPLDDLPDACAAAGASTISIEPRHVLHAMSPEPRTRDPFDRVLLAQADCESMQLVTLDRALRDHPRVWVPSGPG